MEVTRSEPLRIVEGQADNCTLDKHTENWTDLKLFWSEEKQRLQDFDGLATKSLSGSPEKHLLQDSFLEEPASKQRNSEHRLNPHFVKGNAIKDIPTSYITRGFKPHEEIVIGTYVSKRITPGFAYRVRRNQSEETFFKNQPLVLQSVGQGYGKRLTFASDSLNDNDHYFWSDSRPEGFGLTLQVLRAGDTFRVQQADAALVRVTRPAASEDVVLATEFGSHGTVRKVVQVHFRCDIQLKNGETLKDIEVKGIAEVTRAGPSDIAMVRAIAMREFIMEKCVLVPED